MDYISIDRIEDKIVICEDNAGNRLEIAKTDLPDIKEGDCLRKTSNGLFFIDEELTLQIRRQVFKLQNKLFKKQ